MNLFNRLPGFPRTPAGKERDVLRLLPRTLLLGTLLIAIPSLLARLIVSPDDARIITTTDIYVISLIILHWTVLGASSASRPPRAISNPILAIRLSPFQVFPKLSPM